MPYIQAGPCKERSTGPEHMNLESSPYSCTYNHNSGTRKLLGSRFGVSVMNSNRQSCPWGKGQPHSVMSSLSLSVYEQ